MFLEELAWNRNSISLKWLLLFIPVKVDISLSQIITLSKNSLLCILEACLSFTAKTFETFLCIMQKKGLPVLWPCLLWDALQFGLSTQFKMEVFLCVGYTSFH